MWEPTEGVDPSKMQLCYLRKNLDTKLVAGDDSYHAVYAHLHNRDDQTIHVDADTYKIKFKHDFNWWRELPATEKPAPESRKANEQFRERMAGKNMWFASASEEVRDGIKREWAAAVSPEGKLENYYKGAFLVDDEAA